ncbi:G-type lectin S-receptor-like serine/threonine-protein kinase At4g27290 [Andrographis paniculata]|uniref:G-type lectin S-receptor-like serine/threonine-protein kinase At4g27290 n=1 Tax=Andrographis paniculata TaxID=175694 RepID=UPI0021E8FED5|nr:G-type lectin S-receptor-like serine/threonine-protein kinase At4g27290 [Andrographis paniculata]
MMQHNLIIILYAYSFAIAKFSIGSDTLFPNQTLVLGQTLISSNQMFEMGFFSLGQSKNRFMGIWYRNTPDVVVWVANRNNPIADSNGLQLAIARQGYIVISNSRGTIWSTNSSGHVFNASLQLMDTGNLVVLTGENRENLFKRHAWQSFDYPTDTILPGLKFVDDIEAGVEKYLTSWKTSTDPSRGDIIVKIENKGLPDVVLLKKGKKMYRTGTWNGIYFGGAPPFPTPLFKLETIFRQERLISMSLAHENSTFVRITLQKSGFIQHLGLNARKDDWIILNSIPQDPCDEYGKCGSFGMCTTGAGIICECLKGYVPKHKKDWLLQDWSGGCTRTSPMNCDHIEKHGFLEVMGVKYPDMLRYRLNVSLSLAECRSLCLRNCSCTAYANPYITNGDIGCLMWFDELVDTRYLPRIDSKQNIYIRVLNTELESKATLTEEKKNMVILLIVIAIVSGVLVSCFINGGIHYLARQIRQEGRTDEDLELPLYKFSTIISATNNFAEENLIGEGGFGHVYRGKLSMEEEIAVKRSSKNSRQGLAEFKNEVMLIAKLQHRNLVKLLGCCIEREERILVYEYLPNKSLDTFIFDQNRRIHLTWPNRFNIAMGIARGLLYLHHDSRLKVIHRDLKTSNILLDGNLNPKISDFGLARTFEEDQSTSETRRVVGTYGYMSPEYAIAGKFSMKSDIFSLGVVLLEIVSGRKNRDFDNCYRYYTLLEYAWLLWKENRSLELMDDCLNSTSIESQVKRCVQVGLLCVQKFAVDRPDMISVCSMLASDEAIPVEPKEPGFCVETRPTLVRSYASASVNMENGRMSISDVEAR